MMQSLFSKDMMKKVFCQGYLWLLLLLLYSPIFITVCQQYSDTKRRHHHRYLALPALHHAGHSAGVYYRSTLAYHLLSAIRYPECDAKTEADESEPL